MLSVSRLKELIAQTHAHGVATAKKIAELVKQLRSLEALNRKRRKEVAEKTKPKPAPAPAASFLMFDSVTVSEIFATAVAVAGYVGGSFPTFPELLKRFPKAKHLSIAVNSSEDAETLDVENGDAIVTDIPAWVKRQLARGVKRPCIYASLSKWGEINAILSQYGLSSRVRRWVADYTGTPHIPEGFDACQFTDTYAGRNLDASLCHADFLD